MEVWKSLCLQKWKAAAIDLAAEVIFFPQFIHTSHSNHLLQRVSALSEAGEMVGLSLAAVQQLPQTCPGSRCQDPQDRATLLQVPLIPASSTMSSIPFLLFSGSSPFLCSVFPVVFSLHMKERILLLKTVTQSKHFFIPVIIFQAGLHIIITWELVKNFHCAASNPRDSLSPLESEL